MKSTVILCADDFGISAGVNRAILDLAAQGRLSAVSCMSGGQAWVEGAKALKPLHDKVDVGLHITLTYLMPLTKELGERLPSEKTVILKSWLRRLDKTLVEKEIRAQFEKFIEVWGAPPDFIDGHQHMHILPVIRDIVLRLRAEYAPQSWVRSVVDLKALKENKKYGILAMLGWRWSYLLMQHGIAHNQRLRGAYDYSKPVDYGRQARRWCAMPEPVLIYCHPGFPDAGLAKYDSVLEPRRREYDFFNSAAFGAMLDNEVTLVRRPPSNGRLVMKLAHMVSRFLVTGGLNTVFGYFLYASGVYFLGLSPHWAVVLSWGLGVPFSYLMFRSFVFTEGARGWKSFRRFLPTYVALFAFNELALFALVDIADWNKYVAQAIIVPVCAVLSFIINRIFVFK